MTGRRNKPTDRSVERRETDDKAKPPARPADDELYETGDIAAPERDRDDEQRGA